MSLLNNINFFRTAVFVYGMAIISNGLSMIQETCNCSGSSKINSILSAYIFIGVFTILSIFMIKETTTNAFLKLSAVVGTTLITVMVLNFVIHSIASTSMCSKSIINSSLTGGLVSLFILVTWIVIFIWKRYKNQLTV